MELSLVPNKKASKINLSPTKNTRRIINKAALALLKLSKVTKEIEASSIKTTTRTEFSHLKKIMERVINTIKTI